MRIARKMHDLPVPVVRLGLGGAQQAASLPALKHLLARLIPSASIRSGMACAAVLEKRQDREMIVTMARSLTGAVRLPLPFVRPCV